MVTVGAQHGVDTVEDWASDRTKAGPYVLPDNVQNLARKDGYGHTVVGNGLDKLIMLTDANVRDTVDAGAGNDIIVVAKGSAVMTGGARHDMFVFTALNAQPGAIADFDAGLDLLDLRPL
jgi:Ca2+-binding RTX toxin-like protein